MFERRKKRIDEKAFKRGYDWAAGRLLEHYQPNRMDLEDLEDFYDAMLGGGSIRGGGCQFDRGVYQAFETFCTALSIRYKQKDWGKNSG